MRQPSAALSLLVALAGCVADPARDYAAAHPGWVRAFPREEIGIAELLASIQVSNPGRQTLTQVTRRRVIGLGSEPGEAR